MEDIRLSFREKMAMLDNICFFDTKEGAKVRTKVTKYLDDNITLPIGVVFQMLGRSRNYWNREIQKNEKIWTEEIQKLKKELSK